MGDVGVIIKSRIDEKGGMVGGVRCSYRSVLGMMDVDVDWFFAQLRSVYEEFRDDLCRCCDGD